MSTSKIQSIAATLLASLAALIVACSLTVAQQIANDVIQHPDDLQLAPVGNTPTDAAAPENRQRIIDQLVSEMSELIPRDRQQPYSHQDTLVRIATAFVDGDRKTAADLIEKLSADDVDCPPKGLLMAGLSYAVNDPVRGAQLLESTALSHANYPAVFMAFSRLAINQGRLTDALALLEKSKRLMHEGQFNAKLQNHFNLQYLDAMADVAMRQRRTDDAMLLVGELEKIVPDNPKVLFNRAEIEFQKKNVDGSLEYLKKYAQLVPNGLPPELVMASWYQKSGDIDKTDHWVKRAAESYPDNSIVQLEYANWAISREDFASASVAVSQLEKAAGEVLASIAMKGRIAFAKRAYDLAESHFESLFSKQPDDFDIANMYALCLVESSDTAKRDKAKQIGMRNLQAVPDNPVAQAAMGWIFLKTGDAQQAKPLLIRASRSLELSPEMAFFLATYLQQNGDAAQAKLVLEPVLANKALFLYRSAAQELLKKIELATSDLPKPK